MTTELIEVDGLAAELEVVEDIVEVVERAEQGPPGPPGPPGEGLAANQQAALDAANAPSGENPFATMGDVANKADLIGGVIPAVQLPGYVDDVLEIATLAEFPAVGEAGKIYIALDTNLTYRWGGSSYVGISSALALGETAATAHRGDHGAVAYAHSQAPHDYEPTQTAMTQGAVEDPEDPAHATPTKTSGLRIWQGAAAVIAAVFTNLAALLHITEAIGSGLPLWKGGAWPGGSAQTAGADLVPEVVTASNAASVTIPIPSPETVGGKIDIDIDGKLSSDSAVLQMMVNGDGGFNYSYEMKNATGSAMTAFGGTGPANATYNTSGAGVLLGHIEIERDGFSGGAHFKLEIFATTSGGVRTNCDVKGRRVTNEVITSITLAVSGGNFVDGTKIRVRRRW